jgi:NAD(P)-dependent dehydrogenase (short-subunit alcohol dehydrogenase family)
VDRLKDKVVIVTGGARGLGKIFCLALAEEGARVVVADILEEDAKETSEEILTMGGRSIALVVDVTSEQDTLRMVEETVKAFGRVDILVNNAALFYGITRKPFMEIPLEEWDRLMTVNLKGPFLCCRAVFPEMGRQGKGKIINLASETAFTGSPNFTHYVTSKGGVISFTRSLAAELGQYNICVNAVAPGLTDTKAARTIIDDISKYDVSRIPLQRLEQPADLTGVVLFLASDDSDFITGQTIVVNGGRYMH